MPLETFKGTAMASLLASAQASLGEDAEVLRVDQITLVDGRPGLALIAGDPASVAEARRRVEADRRGGLSHGSMGTSGDFVGQASAPVRSEGRQELLPHARRGSNGRDILAFVGPTGAGKTTTVAKLANHPTIFGGRSVGLICLDTYRVGAVEQLRAYAHLARLPLGVVHEARDLPAAMAAAARCDVVLVDCPGRGPGAQRDGDAVQQLLQRIGAHEIHLVLPAGLQPVLAERVVERHRGLGVTHLVASKLDEYPDDWSLFDLAADLGLPMRWITDGQRVPQDVRSALPRLEAAQASGRSRRRRARQAAREQGVA